MLIRSSIIILRNDIEKLTIKQISFKFIEEKVRKKSSKNDLSYKWFISLVRIFAPAQKKDYIKWE